MTAHSRRDLPAVERGLTDGGVTRVYLVRHGETDWNATQRCQGTTDIPLSERGLMQAEALASALRDVDFHAAYTSPLQRARQTVETILKERNLRAVSVPELCEVSYGTWQGLAPHEWPHGAWTRWTQEPWRMAFPEGESLDVVRQRAVPVMERIVRTHAGETVLISAHGHVNRVLLIHASRGSPESFWNIAQPNGGAWVLEYDDCDPTPALIAELPIDATLPPAPTIAVVNEHLR